MLREGACAVLDKTIMAVEIIRERISSWFYWIGGVLAVTGTVAGLFFRHPSVTVNRIDTIALLVSLCLLVAGLLFDRGEL